MGHIYIEKGDYAIREIEEDDLPNLLKWRNSPEIHSKMLTDHIITWEEHFAWFKKIKNRKPVLNFAFTYRGELVGYTGCSQCDQERGTCNPGSYLRPDIKLPVDAGLYIGDLFNEYAFITLGINKMITSVFVDNKRVVKANKVSGYKVIGEDEVIKNNDRHKVFIMSLSAEDWKSQRYL